MVDWSRDIRGTLHDGTGGALAPTEGQSAATLTLTGFAPGVSLTNIVSGPIPEPTVAGNVNLTGVAPAHNIIGTSKRAIPAGTLTLTLGQPFARDPEISKDSGSTGGPRRRPRVVIIGNQIHEVATLLEAHALRAMGIAHSPSHAPRKVKAKENPKVRLGDISSGPVSVKPTPPAANVRIGNKNKATLRLR